MEKNLVQSAVKQEVSVTGVEITRMKLRNWEIEWINCDANENNSHEQIVSRGWGIVLVESEEED